MRLINFILFLTTGAIIGWFASRMIEAEGSRLQKVNLDFDESE